MSKFLYLIFALILVIASGTTGYLMAQKRIITPPVVNKTESTTQLQSSKLFQSQSANLQGKITAVSGSAITITDDKNQTGQFTLSKKLVIYKSTDLPVAGKPYVASASTDIKSIELNQNALISLEVIDDKYQVISISYLPAILQAPPPSAQSTPPAIPNQ